MTLMLILGAVAAFYGLLLLFRLRDLRTASLCRAWSGLRASGPRFRLDGHFGGGIAGGCLRPYARAGTWRAARLRSPSGLASS